MEMDTNKSAGIKTKKTKKANRVTVTGEANISSNNLVQNQNAPESEQLCQFRPIYEQMFPYAASLAYSSRVYDRDDAADLAQQTMLRVWQRVRSGREAVTNLKGFVAHSFHYEHVDWLEKTCHQRQKALASQRQRNRLAKPAPSEPDGYIRIYPDRPPAPARGVSGKVYEFATNFWNEPIVMERLIDCDTYLEPERAIVDSKLSAEVQKALANLPDKWRQALVGQVLEGMSLADLCEAYDWTLDQAKKYLCYAKQQMRLLLTGAVPNVKPWHKKHAQANPAQSQNQAGAIGAA